MADTIEAPSRSRDRLFDGVFFIAILATALAMAGGLAHVFALPNKMTLSREPYFTVQAIYNGWWQFAYVIAVQAVTLLALLFMSRRHPLVMRLVLLAIIALVAAQTIFWFWTEPANVATANWTIAPANWQGLRRQWELSHAADAAFQMVAFCALVLAALARRRRSGIA